MSNIAAFKDYQIAIGRLSYSIWNPKDNRAVLECPPDAMGSTGDLCFHPGDSHLWIRDDQGWRASNGKYKGRNMEHHPLPAHKTLRIQDTDQRFRWTTDTAYRSKKSRDNDKMKKGDRAPGTAATPKPAIAASQREVQVAASEPCSAPTVAPDTSGHAHVDQEEAWKRHAEKMGNLWIAPLLERWESTFGQESTSTRIGLEVLQALLWVPYKIREKESFPLEDCLGPKGMPPSFALIMKDLHAHPENEPLSVSNMDACHADSAEPSVIAMSLIAHGRGPHPYAMVPQYAIPDLPATNEGIGRCHIEVPRALRILPVDFEPVVMTCMVPAGSSTDFHQDGFGSSFLPSARRDERFWRPRQAVVDRGEHVP
ncbi:hypothetical protein CALVIDRAFT_602339 [Calocera viscosa TUFC12733]|uniref:Uncharacterized protein n=1 Tax=Calocera viscosa (strain TUFC12733) TaxID=1330018 RepID=A0A167H793_CALVF|nr:hypothetical protein CALVIDRAFT_602339 [Calocera viscosa TUFC12733]